jgi:hypothetical protein
MKHVPVIRLIHGTSSGQVPQIGTDHDRGCVSCGTVYHGEAYVSGPGDADLVIDARGRYWCLDCGVTALANVRRRVDDRTNYAYPWRFEDTGGPNGQHIHAGQMSVLDELIAKLEANPGPTLPDVEFSQEFVDALCKDDES